MFCLVVLLMDYLIVFYLLFSGWIISISVIKLHLGVSVFMLIVAGFFTVNAVLAVMLLKMVGGVGSSVQIERQSERLDTPSHSVDRILYTSQPRNTIRPSYFIQCETMDIIHTQPTLLFLR